MLAVPLRQRLGGFVQGPSSQRNDQTGFFGHRDKFGGRHLPQFLVVPARKGFESRDFARLKMHERLVSEVKLPIGQRFAQTTFQGESPMCFLQNTWTIDFELSTPLGNLDRGLRLTNDVISIVRNAGR